MYVNEKMISVETVPGMGNGRDKGEYWRGILNIIYLIYCKNVCKFYNVPPAKQ
jgi:hypothetical protein